MKKLPLLILGFAIALFSCEDHNAYYAESDADFEGYEANIAEDIEPELLYSMTTDNSSSENLLGAVGYKSTFTLGDQNGNSSTLVQEETTFQPKQIIRNANMRAEVENYTKARQKIGNFIGQFGGYIASENEENNNYELRNSISIRVNSAEFDAIVDSLSGIAPVWSTKQITARDVSDEYYDVVTRIKTKKKMEERYLEILSKAKTIEDILNVESKLRVIREEIEAKEGRLKYLSNQVSWSTINLTIFEKIEVDEPEYTKPTFGSKFTKALSRGWDGLLSLLLFFVSGWPFWIAFGVITWLVVRKVKQLLKKR